MKIYLGIRTIGSVTVSVDVEYTYCALVPHPLLSDTYDLCPLLIERYPLDGRWKLPGVKALASRHCPQSESVISGTGYHESRLRCTNFVRIAITSEKRRTAHDQHPTSTQIHYCLRTSLTALRYAKTTH